MFLLLTMALRLILRMSIVLFSSSFCSLSLRKMASIARLTSLSSDLAVSRPSSDKDKIRCIRCRTLGMPLTNPSSINLFTVRLNCARSKPSPRPISASARSGRKSNSSRTRRSVGECRPRGNARSISANSRAYSRLLRLIPAVGLKSK